MDDERVLQKKSHQKAKKEYEDSRIGRTWVNNLLKAKLEELLEDFGVSTEDTMGWKWKDQQSDGC